MLTYSSIQNKNTERQALSIQAQLLAKSATEFAILRISSFDKSGGNCLENINLNATPFDINITMWYFMNRDLANCNQEIVTNIPNQYDGEVVIDVVVSTKISSETEHITYHRRTIQKP
jgi:hypothetical protein